MAPPRNGSRTAVRLDARPARDAAGVPRETGPELVTLDEVGDPHDLDIWTEVNGERLQESATSDLVFGIDELVAFRSRAFTLTPDDLIFTGTPPGVGVYREPRTLLEDGDTVTVGIEGVGELTNACRTRSD